MRELDRSNMYSAYIDWYEQAKTSWEMNIAFDFIPSKILYTGMGGSGATGDLISDWISDRIDVPFYVIKGYHLPKWVNEKTLLISVSVSGNTEETLSTFYEGVKKGCKVVAISSNGMLEKVSSKALKFIKIPKPLAPRVGLPYMLYASLRLLSSMGLIDKKEVKHSIDVLRELKDKLSFESRENPSKELANQIYNSLPIIYSSPLMSGVSKRFKASLAENAKMDSIVNFAPELCHNEIVSWEKTNLKDFRIVLLRYKGEEPEVRERMNVIKEVIERYGYKIIEIFAHTNGRFPKIIENLYVCEMATYYSALMRGLDPLPTKNIDLLKSTLKIRLNYIHKYTELENWASDS